MCVADGASEENKKGFGPRFFVFEKIEIDSEQKCPMQPMLFDCRPINNFIRFDFNLKPIRVLRRVLNYTVMCTLGEMFLAYAISTYMMYMYVSFTLLWIRKNGIPV